MILTETAPHAGTLRRQARKVAMTAAELQRLYDYGYWANRTMLDVVSTLPNDEFTRTVAGSYGSIRSTLVHMLSAEAGWLERCGGPPRGPKLEPAAFPTADVLVNAWAITEQRMRAFLRTLTDADMSRSVEFALPGMPPHVMRIEQLLQHAAVHGVHHRGQVALLLRALGHVPGNFDLLLYDVERDQAV